MGELIQQTFPYLLDALFPILVALVGTFMSWALNSLRKKYDSELATGILNRTHIIADIVVRELEHAIVPAIKEAFADGKLSAQEAAKIRELAITRILVYLGDDDATHLHKKTKRSRELVGSIVEAKIHGMHELVDEPDSD